MVGEALVSGVFCWWWFLFSKVGKQFILFLSVCRYLITSLCLFHLTAFRGYNSCVDVGSSSEILILLAYVDVLIRRWYHPLTEECFECPESQQILFLG